MKRILLVFAVTFLSSTAFAQDKTLTVATFNTEFLTRPVVHVKFGEKLKLSAAKKAQWDAPGFRDAKFDEAVPHVAQVVNALSADVVALTEVGNDVDVEALRDEIASMGMQYPHFAVCDCTDTFTHQHVAVLSKFPLNGEIRSFPGREGYYPEADDPESEKDTGLSKGLRVSFTAHGHEIHLYVVHLASEAGGSEKDAQRVAQASIVRRHSLDLLSKGKHVIVAGDLNDHPGQPALNRIRGMDDIWDDLIQTGHARYFDKDELDTRWTYEFQGKRNQIDHVLISRSLMAAVEKQKGITARTLDHGDHMASDHRPFIVTLKFQ